MNTSLVFPIREATEAGAVRRQVATWTSERGWSEEAAGKAALVVTELGRNLALHTTHGGTLLLRELIDDGRQGLEILAIDDGPGMANFGECLRDGVSSLGTAGIGLGVVQRASQHLSVHSQPGVGTVLRSEVWSDLAEKVTLWRCGAVSVPAPGEVVCGDQWSVTSLPPSVQRVVVADGLGHGEFAAQAARKAVEVAAQKTGWGLERLLEEMHGVLKTTRGATVGIADVDVAAGVVSFAGVGNISGVVIAGGRTTSLVSMNGTVGGVCRSLRKFQAPFPTGATLLLASDGLKTHWHLERYAGLLERHPGVLAGILYRDYLRGKDDATVVVLRHTA